MKCRSLVLVTSALATAAICGCGSTSKVSSASLQSRLLPASSLPGVGLQRIFDWSDPVNLVGEGVALPQVTHPSEGVKQFKDAGLSGAAGETFTRGAAGEETVTTLGVAKLDSAASSIRVADWMHTQDLHQPCYSQCIFASSAASIAGIPGVRYVIQSGKVTPPPGPPPGAPKGIKVTVAPAPANYLAEFTIGPYLYWAAVHGDASVKTRFEQGLRLYYAHARATS
jgi:hypothetical protein